MIPVRILATGSVLPGRKVTSEEVVAEGQLPMPPAEIVARTGIESRYWTEKGTRMAPLGAEALRRALELVDLSPSELRRIIFVSSVGGDWINPATACDVAGELGLNGQCDCFDLNNACTGFLTALDLAARSIVTGLGPVGIVVSEFLSAYIRPDIPRPFVIMGDAVAGVIVGPGRPGEGLLGTCLKTDPSFGQTTYIEHPRITGKLVPGQFNISNKEMVSGSIELMAEAAHSAAEQAGVDIGEIEWILPHQPNGHMFDKIVEALGVSPERTLKVVQEIGSTGAASIPVSLDRLMRSGNLRSGHRILMLAIGGGVSYGAMVYRVGTPE